MTMREKLELLERRRAEAELGGGEERLKAQHKKGNGREGDAPSGVNRRSSEKVRVRHRERRMEQTPCAYSRRRIAREPAFESPRQDFIKECTH